METIVSFKQKETYGNDYDYVKVVYLEEEDYYIVIRKYTTMEKEDRKIFADRDLAMYNFNRKMMFLLS